MTKIKKAMISQPMAGLSEEQITKDKIRAVKYLEGLGYEVLNTRFTEEWYEVAKQISGEPVNKSLLFMAKSLESMSECHHVHFVRGWTSARGCKVEHMVALEYGLTVSHECEEDHDETE